LGGAPETIMKGFRLRRARRQTRFRPAASQVYRQPNGIGGFLSPPQRLFKQSKSRSGTVLYGIGF